MSLLVFSAVHIVILRRQRSLECHPDKHPDFPTDGKEALTQLCRIIIEAKDALSVPVQKPWWDRTRAETTKSFGINMFWDMIKQSVIDVVEMYADFLEELEIKFNRLIYTVKSKWL